MSLLPVRAALGGALLISAMVRVAAAAPQSGAALGSLYAALAAAPDRTRAAAIEARIEAAWKAGISPTATVLVDGGHAALAANQPHKAVDDLDSAIDLQPDTGSLWRERGVARFDAGDSAGAVADLGRAIDLDSHDFLAWETLSQVLEDEGNADGALAAWQQALTLDPHAENAAARLDTLRRKVQGQRA